MVLITERLLVLIYSAPSPVRPTSQVNLDSTQMRIKQMFLVFLISISLNETTDLGILRPTVDKRKLNHQN